jgi:hypothetical protein
VNVSKGSCLYRNAESEVCRVQISGLWVSTSQLLNTAHPATLQVMLMVEVTAANSTHLLHTSHCPGDKDSAT